MGCRIHITDDFDPEKIAESGQCFRWEKLPGDSWRLIHGQRCLILREQGPGEYLADCGPDDFEQIWRPYFDLDRSYAEIRAMIDAQQDPFLAAAAAQGAGIRILRQDPWEMMISFIISQNRNIPAIKRSIELLCRAAGEKHTDSEGNPYYGFPSPEAIASMSADELDSCRLGYRCRYVKCAAEAVLAGTGQGRSDLADHAGPGGGGLDPADHVGPGGEGLDLGALPHMDREAAFKALTGICGIGEKVASCIMLFGLHHLDTFPVDVWIRRVLDNEYPGGYPFERYSPYNGVFQQYMFAYYRSLRD